MLIKTYIFLQGVPPKIEPERLGYLIFTIIMSEKKYSCTRTTLDKYHFNNIFKKIYFKQEFRYNKCFL